MDMEKFQDQVKAMVYGCFGKKAASNINERQLRFCEESMELLQATGMDRQQIFEVVDYVYNRKPGMAYQEAGGVMVTLSALLSCIDLHLDGVSSEELTRVIANMDTIREKQKAKPAHIVSPDLYKN